MKQYIQIRNHDHDEDCWLELAGIDERTGKPVSSGRAIYMPSGRMKTVFDIYYHSITGERISEDELRQRYGVKEK